MNTCLRWMVAAACAAVVTASANGAIAGPETTLREFASGQIKKGVRAIGMGGDGATVGNYSLVYNESGSAIVDYGVVRFFDTGNTFTFTGIGFTTPKFWKDAALYLIAMSQHATDVETWTMTPPDATKPPSRGDGSNQAVFLKFAKPITKTISAGLLLSYELSQMTLLPHNGAAPIRFETSWRPSGGGGITWKPAKWLLTGVRVILSHDEETRTQGPNVREGFLRSYEYRWGASFYPWPGGVLDGGVAVLDRHSGLEQSSSLKAAPTLGIEQALVPKRVWMRGGLDETTWAYGMSVRVAPFKIDGAFLQNLAEARTGDTFGKRNVGYFVTLSYDYVEPK